MITSYPNSKARVPDPEQADPSIGRHGLSVRACTVCLVFAAFIHGCSSNDRLPEMVPDSSGFSAIPRDAAEAEEWKRVLDPKNRAGLVKTVQLDYVDLTLKKPLSNGIVPLNHPVNVVATVQLGPGIKSVPLAGRIRVFEKQPNGRRRFETHGYAKATSQDFAKGTIIFEKECRPLDAGTYQVEFRFHHFASRPQTFTVTDK